MRVLIEHQSHVEFTHFWVVYDRDLYLKTEITKIHAMMGLAYVLNWTTLTNLRFDN